MPATAESRDYAAAKDQRLKRLKRLKWIEGQVRGIQGMVEDDRHLIDVLTQISAIQASWTRSPPLLDDHARHCVVSGAAGGRPRTGPMR